MGIFRDKAKEIKLPPPANLPLMRNPMMPLAATGRSPMSQKMAMERFKGISEREDRLKLRKMGITKDLEEMYKAKR